MQSELSGSIGHFLEDRDDSDEEEGTTAEVGTTQGSTGTEVNPGLNGDRSLSASDRGG